MIALLCAPAARLRVLEGHPLGRRWRTGGLLSQGQARSGSATLWKAARVAARIAAGHPLVGPAALPEDRATMEYVIERSAVASRSSS